MARAFLTCLTAERARQVLDLDVETGVLRWRARDVRPAFARTDRSWNGRYAGAIAGSPHNAGYTRIAIDDQDYLAHRVIFLMTNGRWPDGEVDHHDLDRRNNRPLNLRDATPTLNKANRRVHSANVTGLKGVKLVRLSGGRCRYQARIGIGGRHLHLGVFDTPEAAHAAYCAAAVIHFGQFSRAA